MCRLLVCVLGLVLVVMIMIVLVLVLLLLPLSCLLGNELKKHDCRKHDTHGGQSDEHECRCGQRASRVL